MVEQGSGLDTHGRASRQRGGSQGEDSLARGASGLTRVSTWGTLKGRGAGVTVAEGRLDLRPRGPGEVSPETRRKASAQGRQEGDRAA